MGDYHSKVRSSNILDASQSFAQHMLYVACDYLPGEHQTLVQKMLGITLANHTKTDTGVILVWVPGDGYTVGLVCDENHVSGSGGEERVCAVFPEIPSPLEDEDVRCEALSDALRETLHIFTGPGGLAQNWLTPAYIEQAVELCVPLIVSHSFFKVR